jgi:hypothetical protein
MRFTSITPSAPEPSQYLEVVDDSGIRSDVGALERADSPAVKGPSWAAIDQRVIEAALIAPFGLSTTGVLVSERLDGEQCQRFHPVYGLDFSSLCLS